MSAYTHIQDVRSANERAGHHFFEPDTMRFFRSRISDNLYDGRYFVTSEQFDSRSPRLYSIREALTNGHIEAASGFQQFSSRGAAVRAIALLVDARPHRLTDSEMLDGQQYRSCQNCTYMAHFCTRTGALVCDGCLIDQLRAER